MPESDLSELVAGRSEDLGVEYKAWMDTSQPEVRAKLARGPITTTHDHTRNSDGRPLPSSPSPATRRDLALRYAKSSAPAPVAPTAQPGNQNAKSERRTG
jgi:putative transposase